MDYEPSSPVSSASSGSPAPEEIALDTQISVPTRSGPGPAGSNKRRGAPSGGAQGSPFARDAKSRRREDSGSQRLGGAQGSSTGGIAWGPEGQQKKDREELVDVKLAEALRKGVYMVDCIIICV
jgi:hypothetical protein